MALYALWPDAVRVAIANWRIASAAAADDPGHGRRGAGVAVAAHVPGMVTLYLSALLLGTSFHFFFVTVTASRGHRRSGKPVAQLCAGQSRIFRGRILGPMAAGFSIDYLGHLPTFLVLATFTVIPILFLLFRGISPPGGQA